MNLTDPSTLCLLLLAAVVVLLMFKTRTRLGEQQQTNKKNSATGNSSRKLDAKLAAPDAADADNDLARWEVQVHETARELSAKLDAKLGLLQALSAEADRAAERLEQLLQQVDSAHIPEDRPDSPNHGNSDGEQPSGNQPSADIELSTDRSRRREEIYQLADYGFAPAEIARRVGSPVGEVELILSLRQS